MIPDAMIRRHTHLANAEALFSLSQTQRRLAHLKRQEADVAKAAGNWRWHIYLDGEARRLWDEAFRHLAWAREELEL